MHPGLLESLRRGEAAALVRYEGKYAATTLTVMGDRAGFAWNDPPANNHIDELVSAKLQAHQNAAVAADATTTNSSAACISTSPACRRRPSKCKSFVDDKRDTKAKRDALVDKLVGNDDYVDFWTNKWADLLMVNRKFLGVEGATAFRNWIRGELAANTPYDQFVHEDPHRQRFDERQPGRLVLQNAAHARSADGEHDAVVPRHAVQLQQVPRPSLRALDAGPVLPPGGVLRPNRSHERSRQRRLA